MYTYFFPNLLKFTNLKKVEKIL